VYKFFNIAVIFDSSSSGPRFKSGIIPDMEVAGRTS